MADYQNGSRLKNGVKGTFRGETVIFPRRIDYDSIEFTSFHTISAGEEFREDLISLHVYQRPDLGWFIMGANNIDQVEDLRAGITIRIPPTKGII